MLYPCSLNRCKDEPNKLNKRALKEEKRCQESSDLRLTLLDVILRWNCLMLKTNIWKELHKHDFKIDLQQYRVDNL